MIACASRGRISSVPSNLMLPSHGWHDHDDQDQYRHDHEAEADRSDEKYSWITASDQHGAAQIFLEHWTQHEAQKHRSKIDAEFHPDVAENSEQRREVHLDGAVAAAVNTNGGKGHNRRKQDSIRHFEQLHPYADQGQIEDHQHQVADPHAGD